MTKGFVGTVGDVGFSGFVRRPKRKPITGKIGKRMKTGRRNVTLGPLFDANVFVQGICGVNSTESHGVLVRCKHAQLTGVTQGVASQVPCVPVDRLQVVVEATELVVAAVLVGSVCRLEGGLGCRRGIGSGCGIA